MQDLLVVKIIDGQSYLREPVEDLRLSEVPSLLFHLLDLGVHVPQLAVDHHDTKVALVVSEGVLIGDNVDVPELLKDFELVLDVFPLLLVDLQCFDFLERVVIVFICLVLAQENVA